MSNDSETLLDLQEEINTIGIGRMGLNETSSSKFNFATIDKTEDGIQYIEYWILANAYYDPNVERFIKQDATATSFGIQIQAKGTYPGEAEFGTKNTGVNIWRNPPKADTYKDNSTYDYSDWTDNNYIGAERLSDEEWVEFGLSAGWTNNLMTDSYGGVTIGGNGIEIDGSGIYPFTRLTNSTFSDGTNNYYILGMLDNAYHPNGATWECDSNEYEAWFFGLKYPQSNNKKDSANAKFVVMHNTMDHIDSSASGYSIDDMDIRDWETILEVGTTSAKAMVDGTLSILGGGGSGNVVDDIIEDNMNAVTSNAVYQGMQSKLDVEDAFSGDYDDLTNKPSIPEEVSDLSDGSDVIMKSNTSGLVKNDGTIDTTQYLSQHQDITGKLDIAQTSYKGKNVVVDNSTGNISFEDKPTIPTKISDLTDDSDFIEKSSTSGLVKNDGTIDTSNYLTQHQSLESTVVTLTKQSTAESGYAATYVLYQGGTAISPKINIPKDFLVKSASVKTCTTDNVPVQGYVVGDKYLDFVVNTIDGDETPQHIYLNVKELTDVYNADNVTLELSSGNVFSIKDGGVTYAKISQNAIGTGASQIAAGNHTHPTMEETSYKVTSSTGITSSSTDIQYPSAKAVYEHVNSIIGDIDSWLVS